MVGAGQVIGHELREFASQLGIVSANREQLEDEVELKCNFSEEKFSIAPFMTTDQKEWALEQGDFLP